jgi:hypothetical protein
MCGWALISRPAPTDARSIIRALTKTKGEDGLSRWSGPRAGSSSPWMKSIRSQIRSLELVVSLGLHLDRNPVLLGGSGRDRQLSPRAFVLAAHQLTDRPDRVHEGCARLIRHEAL